MCVNRLELQLLEEPLVLSGLVTFFQQQASVVTSSLPLWRFPQCLLVKCGLGEVDVDRVTGGHHVVVVHDLKKKMKEVLAFGKSKKQPMIKMALTKTEINKPVNGQSCMKTDWTVAVLCIISILPIQFYQTVWAEVVLVITSQKQEISFSVQTKQQLTKSALNLNRLWRLKEACNWLASGVNNRNWVD